MRAMETSGGVYVAPSGDRLTYHFLVAVDIEGFSTLSAAQQKRIQADLHTVLENAAEAAGLDRNSWLRQVGGDGELAILPSETDGLRLLVAYPRALAMALARVNRRRARRLRLRLSMHHGPLSDGVFGAVGRAPIVVSRLVDADVLRQELRDRPRLDLVLIMSGSLYSDVVETEFGGLDPSEFHRVDVHAKGVTYPAYIHRAVR
ncbi:hypothetical protein GCM10010191_25130 [Actinomadura vinacea]|uniref:Guanylate cyclase domain-containing protein n=1 Tax=Actinomadura vinacea TaxID=115336 RepID=A0ABN3IU98_9ACTN